MTEPFFLRKIFPVRLMPPEVKTDLDRFQLQYRGCHLYTVGKHGVMDEWLFSCGVRSGEVVEFEGYERD